MTGTGSAVDESPGVPVSDESSAVPGRIGPITVEHALYFAVFIIATAVRLWGLTRMPLNSLEAANTVAAWHDAMGTVDPMDLAPASPLFLHIQTLLFWLGASGDAAARAGAAFAGALMVLVPWTLRGFLGRSAALALSILFAVDPWLVALSRFADGAMLSTLLALSLLALLVALAHDVQATESSLDARNVETRDRRTAMVAIAVLGGLFLSSGHMVWSLLPVILVFVALNYSALRQTAHYDRRTLIWFGGAFLLGASGWFFRPTHVSLVSGSLTTWVNLTFATRTAPEAFTLAGRYPILWPVISLVTEQPFVTLFGLGALAHMTWRRRTQEYSALHWRTLLWVWLAWGVILCLLPGRSPFSLLVVEIPLLFSAAYGISVFLQVADLGPKMKETIAVAGTLILLLVSAAFWAAALISAPSMDMLMLQAVALTLLLSAAILVFYGIWVAWRDAAWVAVAVVGAALFLVSWGSTSRINHRFDLGRAGGLFSESGATDVRRLAADVKTISSQRAGDPLAIGVVVDGPILRHPGNSAQVVEGTPALDPDPILAWYLRDMRRLQWGAKPSTDMDQPTKPLIVSTEDGHQGAVAGADYVGSRYEVRRLQSSDGGGLRNSSTTSEAATSTAGSLRDAAIRVWSGRVQPWLRWMIYRESDVSPAVEHVVLWAPRPE